jgi:hypothetical protein
MLLTPRLERYSTGPRTSVPTDTRVSSMPLGSSKRSKWARRFEPSVVNTALPTARNTSGYAIHGATAMRRKK